MTRPPVEAPTSPPRASVTTLLALFAVTAAFVLWVVSLTQFDYLTNSEAGLAANLPAIWWIALVLAVAGVVVAVSSNQNVGRRAAPAVAVLVLVLHGTLVFSEPSARFAASFDVAGFSDFIARYGHALPNVDTRAYWPGLYSATAVMSHAMGVPVTWFLRGAPLVFEGLYLFPLKWIANITVRTEPGRWAALAIFTTANWIDQDYYSPQAVGLLLYLVCIAIVLQYFSASTPRRDAGSTGRVARIRAILSSWRARDWSATAPSTNRDRIRFYAVFLIAAAAMVVTHQFSPAALVASLLMLVLVGRSTIRWTWLLVTVAFFAWLSWIAEPYWVHHLGTLFGGLGQGGKAVSSNVGVRLRTTDPLRKLVTYGRLVDGAVIYVAAGVAAYVLHRRRRTPLTLTAVLVAPSLVSIGANYGGEAFLRVLLFGLPAAALLIGNLLDSLRGRYTWWLVLIVLAGLFPLARYGNEEFEAFTPSEVAAAQYVAANIPAHGYVFEAAPDAPVGAYSASGYFTVKSFEDPAGQDAAQIGAVLAGTKACTYIYLSRATFEYGYVYLDYPPDWQARLQSSLESIRGVEHAYAGSGVDVYSYGCS